MTMYSKMFCNRNAGDKLNHKITSRLEGYNLQVITNMKVGLKLTLHDRSWRFNDDVWNARPTQRSGQLTNIKIFYVDLRGSRNDRAASLFAFPNIFFYMTHRVWKMFGVFPSRYEKVPAKQRWSTDPPAIVVMRRQTWKHIDILSHGHKIDQTKNTSLHDVTYT